LDTRFQGKLCDTQRRLSGASTRDGNEHSTGGFELPDTDASQPAARFRLNP